MTILSIIISILVAGAISYFLANRMKGYKLNALLLKEDFKKEIKDLELINAQTSKEFIDKIEYLKKEVKRHLTTVREYEILLQELNDKETLALDRITIVKKEVSEPVIIPVISKTSKKSKQK